MLLFLVTVTACDYQPTVFNYNSKTGDVYVVKDTSKLYIYSLQIKIKNKILFDYPTEGDSTKRSLVNIDDYFKIDSKRIFMEKRLKISIRSGGKDNSFPFDKSEKTIGVFNSDSLYVFICGQ